MNFSEATPDSFCPLAQKVTLEYRMIRDARVLRAGFVPREVQHRDAEVNHLTSVLDPLTDDQPAETAVVTGPSGAGKTCISQFVTERLREQVLDIDVSYVNCWRNYSRFRTLYQLLDDIGSTVDIHRQSTPHDELVDRIQQYDGPRVVVILDEADQLEDPGLIYDLHSLPQFALLCIANREEELFGKVDERIVSRLRASEHVRMGRYTDEQLQDILEDRVKWGLEIDVITDRQIAQIADVAAGDARLAIGILRTAASRANQQNADHISDVTLEEAAKAAAVKLAQKTVDSLTPHQRIVYDIVNEVGPASPKEIYAQYETQADEPRTLRTVRKYLLKMEQYNLLKSVGSSRDRAYTAVNDEVPSQT